MSEQLGLSTGGSRLFEIVGRLKGVDKEDFLLEVEDPILLEVPVESAGAGLTQAFEGALVGGGSEAVLSTIKVDRAELEALKRSKKVDDVRVHLLRPSAQGRPVTIGRSDENDIQLDVAGVSRKHAELHRTAGQWLLVDLGSNNGTFVNGKQIAAKTKVVLNDRENVWFASYRAVFLYPEGFYDLAAKLSARKR